MPTPKYLVLFENAMYQTRCHRSNSKEVGMPNAATPSLMNQRSPGNLKQDSWYILKDRAHSYKPFHGYFEVHDYKHSGPLFLNNKKNCHQGEHAKAWASG